MNLSNIPNFQHILRALALSLFAQVAQAQTILTVDSPEALAEAWLRAPDGAEIALAPGDYGRLVIRRDTAAVVLRSADPTRPASFSGADVQNVDGLRIEGLLFDYVFSPEDEIFNRHFSFQNVSNLEIRDNVFDGDLARGLGAIDNGYGFGTALRIWHAENVLVAGNTIFDFYRGLITRNIQGLTVRGNDISAIRSDGMNFVQISGLLVEGNHIHNFNRSLNSDDHSDMIQLWTSRTEWPTHDVVIRGNLLDAGSGWFTQSIFMRNERSDILGSVDRALYYRNVLIEENVIINAHTHGITVGDTIGLTIRNNTVVQVPSAADRDPNSGVHIPSIRVAEVNEDVVVTGNIVARIVAPEGQSGWRISDNLLVQNQSRLQPGHYSQVFVGGDTTDPARFLYRADGLVTAGIGAEMLRAHQSLVDLLP